MPLVGVTITGADDAVDVNDLALFTCEYPFVEWGILFSPKREGGPRYPKPEWVKRLREVPYMKLAAHFCGTCARDTLVGSDRWLLDKNNFQRVQINGFLGARFDEVSFTAMAGRYSHEFILQIGNEAGLQFGADVAKRAKAVSGARASLLFDPSGGRGIEAFKWPTAPHGARLGYAGGIKPENVVDVVGDIGAVNLTSNRPYWIDMESGVRVDDKFNLGLVREVLSKVAPYVASWQGNS